MKKTITLILLFLVLNAFAELPESVSEFFFEEVGEHDYVSWSGRDGDFVFPRKFLFFTGAHFSTARLKFDNEKILYRIYMQTNLPSSVAGTEIYKKINGLRLSLEHRFDKLIRLVKSDRGDTISFCVQDLDSRKWDVSVSVVSNALGWAINCDVRNPYQEDGKFISCEDLSTDENPAFGDTEGFVSKDSSSGVQPERKTMIEILLFLYLLFIVPSLFVLSVGTLFILLLRRRCPRLARSPLSLWDLTVPFLVPSLWLLLLYVNPHSKDFDDIGEVFVLAVIWLAMIILRCLLVVSVGRVAGKKNLFGALTVALMCVLTCLLFLN